MLGRLKHVRTNKRQLGYFYLSRSTFGGLFWHNRLVPLLFHLLQKQWELYKYHFTTLKQPTNAFVSHQFVARHKGV